MSDYSELERLAEAANAVTGDVAVDIAISSERGPNQAEIDAVTAYVSVATPATILALIAENKRLTGCIVQRRAQAEQYDQALIKMAAERDRLRAEVAGLKTGYEAYERLNAELKAQCEALRKDADRFRRMRAMTLAQIEDTQDEFDAEFDRQLDAAMGNGEQS
jgi:cell division protein FtsB